MDYEKAYKETFNVAKCLHEACDATTKKQMERLFPQLVESDDERNWKKVKRAIRIFFTNPTEANELLAWLEKQKERGPLTKEEEYELHRVIEFLEDETCPSEWISLLHDISCLPYKKYDEQKEQKPVQSDAEKEYVRTLKSLVSDFVRANNYIERGYYQQIYDWLDGRHVEQKEQKPAEWNKENFPKDIEKDATQFCFNKGINITPRQAKEIATHYLMVGHNEGYVDGRKNAHIPAKELELPSTMDFKQEWSEEDNIGWDEAFACVTKTERAAKDEGELQNAVTAEKWLKEIKFKYYVHPVKQEWSEEDEKNLELVIDCIYEFYPDPVMKYKLKDWLKFLRPQSHWKPTEEQMKALLRVVDKARELHYSSNSGYDEYDVLRLLYKQLKKLM